MGKITIDETELKAKVDAAVQTKAQEIADAKLAEIEQKRVPSYLQSAPAVFVNGMCKGGYDVETKEGAALIFARSLRALKSSQMERGTPTPDFQHAAQIMKEWQAESKMDSDELIIKALQSGRINKSVQAGNQANGGLFISEQHYANVIEYLSANVVVRGLKGVEFINMPSGGLTLTRETNLLTGGWVGEEGARDPETPTVGTFNMTAKKLLCLAIISNDWLRRADLASDKNVLARMQKGVALTEDSGLLRGNGTAYAPLGIRYQILSGNTVAQTGTTIAAITTDLLGTIGKVNNANVQLENPVWIMHPSKKTHLMSLRNATTDTYAFPDVLNGTLFGAPIITTTAVPTNLGGGGNESEIYFGEPSAISIGDTTNFEATVSDSLSYSVSGTMYSAFAKDQSGIRLIKETDICLRHQGAFAVTTGITWG